MQTDRFWDIKNQNKFNRIETGLPVFAKEIKGTKKKY
jgi:hypothetical protein